MGRERAQEQALSPWQAAFRLQLLSAYAHANPGRVSKRLYALMETHRTHRVEAVIALEEALHLLASLRVDPTPWLDTHVGHAGYWPCAEVVETVERVRPTSESTKVE